MVMRGKVWEREGSGVAVRKEVCVLARCDL